MALFCKHNWKVLSETVTKSTFEIAVNALNKLSLSDCKIPHQLCKDSRKHIVILSCSKCGKLSKQVTEI